MLCVGDGGGVKDVSKQPEVKIGARDAEQPVAALPKW